MICEKCGEDHPLDDMELTFRRPDEAARLTDEERSRRVRENPDLCVIDGERFFVRAILPLPVESRDLAYAIGLWVEVSRDSFGRIYDLWDEEGQSDEPPFPATVANEIPIAAGSLGLAAQLQLTGPRTRPRAFLEPAGHPLYLEQAHGTDAHRVAEYTALFA
jgi:hypothetical protein